MGVVVIVLISHKYKGEWNFSLTNDRVGKR